jgi:hypothetical protein
MRISETEAALRNRRLERLPSSAQPAARWLLQPAARPVRLPASALLGVGGVFGMLPVLGFWMLPAGLLLFADDVPPLTRRPARCWFGSSGGGPIGSPLHHTRRRPRPRSYRRTSHDPRLLRAVLALRTGRIIRRTGASLRSNDLVLRPLAGNRMPLRASDCEFAGSPTSGFARK